MLEAGRATAEQPQRLASRVPEFVFLAGSYGNGVAGLHFAQLVLDAHPARAVRDEINLLRLGVLMLLRASAGGLPRLGETLIANDGIAIREQLANLRPVLRDERRNVSKVLHIQARDVWGMAWRGNSKADTTQ